MSQIDIRRSHSLGRAGAREAAQRIAEELGEKFSLSYGWEGDVLHFERLGVHGRMQVEPEAVHVVVRLGMLLAPLRTRFESEIHRYMDELFAPG